MHIPKKTSWLCYAIVLLAISSCERTILPEQKRSKKPTPFKREIISGANGYNEYRTGNLPIILSAPHGGNLKPAELPDRDCVDCVTSTDLNTREVLKLTDSLFTVKTGCYVHAIFTNLHRSKIDDNRPLPEATDSNAVTLPYYNEFHNYLATAQSAVNSKYGRGLVIDIHGHGHTIQRLELGYIISGSELRLADNLLEPLKNESSIRKLNQIAIGTPGFINLIKGTKALGTLLANRGYPSVPSSQIPYPLSGESYFSGGFITETYGSYTSNITDAIQIEANYTNVRDSNASRIAFAQALSDALIEYFKLYYSNDLNTICK
jgi:N-formylglutamate amidohydrolase